MVWYGFRWILSLFLMELMTHFFYYNAFAIRLVVCTIKDGDTSVIQFYSMVYVWLNFLISLLSGVWKQLTPMDNFIIGYGVSADIYCNYGSDDVRINELSTCYLIPCCSIIILQKNMWTSFPRNSDLIVRQKVSKFDGYFGCMLDINWKSYTSLRGFWNYGHEMLRMPTRNQ